MEIAEVGKLLTLMAAYDQRKVGEADVMAWSEIVGKFDFEDAKAAVLAHYATTADRIMPAHIAVFVKNREADRAARSRPGMTMSETVESDIPDADPDDVQGYLRALREGRTRPYDDGTARPRPMGSLAPHVFPRLPRGDG